jgi:hypothetical protein
MYVHISMPTYTNTHTHSYIYMNTCKSGPRVQDNDILSQSVQLPLSMWSLWRAVVRESWLCRRSISASFRATCSCSWATSAWKSNKESLLGQRDYQTMMRYLMPKPRVLMDPRRHEALGTEWGEIRGAHGSPYRAEFCWMNSLFLATTFLLPLHPPTWPE